MIKEIWKDKKDYEGLYEVSNLGRMRSLDRWVNSKNGSMQFIKGRVLKLIKNRYGYLYVNLYKNNIKKTYQVHRLVAEAFIPNPNNYKEVNHKDECKTNNVVSNLEWCTASYNTNYGTRNKRISKSNTNGKRSKTVLQYTLDGQFVKEWSSTMECGRNGYSQGNVAACCRGELKTYKGFIWRYK